MTPAPAPIDWSSLPGRLIVVSGPSGSGKTTLVRRVVERSGGAIRLSTSATTRKPRPGEQDGREYIFLDRAAFEAERDSGRLLESAEVHGNLYGTPIGPVRAALEAGDCVILEIDVQGGMQVAGRFPATILVFVETADFPTLEARLRGRSTEDEPTILRRLANARREIELSRTTYHHRIINDDLDRAIVGLTDLLTRIGCGERQSDA